MRIIKISLLVSFVFFITSFLFFKKEAIACEAITFSHFEEIRPDVFADASIPKEQRTALLTSIKMAHDRINQVYGELSVSPRLVATNDLNYEKFGLNPTGMQSSGFFRECIFLGPKGINADVISHELVHAEVRYRTDFLTEFVKLPPWFIEGTAIKVDYREPFLLENIDVSEDEIAQIKSLVFLHDFPNTSVRAYQASRVAIEYLDAKTLYVGLERLNQGASFEEVFGLQN